MTHVHPKHELWNLASTRLLASLFVRVGMGFFEILEEQTYITAVFKKEVRKLWFTDVTANFADAIKQDGLEG